MLEEPADRAGVPRAHNNRDCFRISAFGKATLDLEEKADF
jgi:hypothetical protein